MENKMSLAKEALIGPAGDVLGIPSAIGYFIGKRKGKNMAEEGAERPKLGPRSAAGFLFVPGATGYMIGKRVGYDDKKEEAAKKPSEEKKASATKSDTDKGEEGKTDSLARRLVSSGAKGALVGLIGGTGLHVLGARMSHLLSGNEGRQSIMIPDRNMALHAAAGMLGGVAKELYDGKKEKNASLAKSAADLVPENIDWSFWRDMPQGRGPVVESFGRRVLGEDRVSVPRIEQAVSYAQSQGYPDGAIAEIRNQGNLAFALEAIHAVAPR